MKIPRAETVILMAFLVCTALWAMSKCSERRSSSIRKVRETDNTETEDRPVKPDTVTATTPKLQEHHPSEAEPLTAQPVQPKPGAKPQRPTLSNNVPPPVTTPPANTGGSSSNNAGTTLYVSIEGLKVRKEPGLKGEAIAELRLYEPVTFMNKKTEWTQEISLGYEKVTDHWVKIKTSEGKEGWVFGAGVHYYKTKRKGTVEEKKSTESTPKKKNK